MTILKNPRHERFAQALAKGKTADEAYVLAGFAENRGNAATLKANQSVQARVAEILDLASIRAEISVEKVLREYSRVAFMDMRRLLRWTGNQPNLDEAAAEESGEVEITAANFIRLFDSDDLDDDTAACISEISQTKDGMLKVKLADKMAALGVLAKHLGIANEKVVHSGTVEIQQTGPDFARQTVEDFLSRKQAEKPKPVGDTKH